MALLEDHSASFIVRIWRELGDELGAGTTASQEWRGSIEHVQSGRKVYFRELKAIAEFMQRHLAEIGIETPTRFWELIEPELEGNQTDEETWLSPTVPPPDHR